MSKEKMFPMNLQFFADEPKDAPQEDPKDIPKETPKDEPKGNPEDSPQDEKSLNEQLQSALVEMAKLRRQLDKTSSEAADYRRKWKDSLTETERASQEKAEAEAARQAEFDEMKRRLAINDLVSEYMDREFPKDIATKIATARYDGENDTVNVIEKQMDEVKRKKWEADFLKSRPDINAGTGTAPTISKEDFDKMTLMEKSKLKRENAEEYKRLLAL